MTTISAKVIAHSRHPKWPVAPDLFTVQVRYPRFVHPETLTHRVFSRNASSSRATPIWRLIWDIICDPAAPVEWGSNRPGMQAGAELTGWRRWLAQFAWFSAMWFALGFAWLAGKAGAHKQVVNRMIEPWSHISVIITSTEWDNFFALRCHPDADPTMRLLAECIRDAINDSRPQMLSEGLWHTPYAKSFTAVQSQHQKPISVARCARVSYLTHDGQMTSPEADNTLAGRLLTSKHMSPFEHQATPLFNGSGKSNLGPHWQQYRSILE